MKHTLCKINNLSQAYIFFSSITQHDIDKIWWQDLKDCIDHSIEDVEGKKAKDYANPELKKILVGVEEDRGFCL